MFVTAALGDSPAVYRLDHSGREQWGFDSRVDIYRGHWPTSALGVVFQNDDGLYLLDDLTGRPIERRGLDSWGQTLTDGKRFYATNTWHIAGPKVRVAALDRTGAMDWSALNFGITREDVMDDHGALALANGRLFHSASFRYANLDSTGLYSYRARDGRRNWFLSTKPRTHISVAWGSIFSVETLADQTVLTARRTSTGAIRWRTNAAPPLYTPPALSDQMVYLIDSEKTLTAFAATNGTVMWRRSLKAPIRRFALGPPWTTHMAIARGSRTILTTEGDQLVVRSLDTGRIQSSVRAAAGAKPHSPTIGRGMAVVVADGKVYGYRCSAP